MDKKLKLKTELAKKLKKETSVTGTGASVTPGEGAGVATKYAFGKRDNKGTPKDWKSAPSIPNRKSKAMDYKELWENKEITTVSDITATLASDASKRLTIPKGSKVQVLVTRLPKEPNVTQLDYNGQIVNVSAGPFINQYLYKETTKPEVKASELKPLKEEAGTDEVVATLNNPNLDPDVKKTLMSAYRQGHITADGLIMIVNLVLNKGSLQEGYAQFRNATKMRSKPDQFHQAVKEIKRKMNEINRIFEYVDRLKTELSEGEDLKYKKYTENAFQQIKESAKALFLKSTKLK